ncbi:uncharacterized protein ARMOST_10309 [Armillaria ostoyae]|uniref:Uncharacterized protein n=1 Tax=Armillaria ostoyae TaxID=47428 RepID=A0A284RDX8_ARMOS|nr:uncharacterized protein ARMOST_10309 [Armillaria ostoyae]
MGNDSTENLREGILASTIDAQFNVENSASTQAESIAGIPGHCSSPEDTQHGTASQFYGTRVTRQRDSFRRRRAWLGRPGRRGDGVGRMEALDSATCRHEKREMFLRLQVAVDSGGRKAEGARCTRPEGRVAFSFVNRVASDSLGPKTLFHDPHPTKLVLTLPSPAVL